MFRHSLPLLIAISVAGCAHKPSRPVIPQTITVTVTKFVPIDDALTGPCGKEPPKDRSAFEAYRVAHKRGLQLDACSERMQQIREISHKGATPDQPLE